MIDGKEWLVELSYKVASWELSHSEHTGGKRTSPDQSCAPLCQTSSVRAIGSLADPELIREIQRRQLPLQPCYAKRGLRLAGGKMMGKQLEERKAEPRPLRAPSMHASGKPCRAIAD